jgi:acetyl esterase/lipase
MKKISTLLALCLMICINQIQAQTRYLDEVFNNVQVTTNVTYAVNATVLLYPLYNEAVPEPLKMDVYEPVGDTSTARPLVLYFHTGNFLPFPNNQSPSGTRSDSNVVNMCQRLARMGYVVASCDYRLGWNPTATTIDERVYTLINAAYRGVQDCRTAIRYFRMTEATLNNPYKIDPNKIAVWGQGTGGYIAFASATIDQYQDIVIPKFIHNVEVQPGVVIPLPMVIESVNGDIYGTSVGINPQNNDTLCYVNHPGYSSDFNVMINMGGACGDSSWVTAGDVPMISFQTPTDPFAPYNIGTVVVPGFDLPVVDVSGSYHVQKIANGLGLNTSFLAVEALNDVYTQRANVNNDGYYGLFPLTRPAGSDADSSPWEWWDSATNPNNANGLAANPTMSALKGKTYLDSIQAYSAPRMMCALNLPNSPCQIAGVVNDECPGAADINPLLGGALNIPVVSSPYSNVGATGENPVLAGINCWIDTDVVNNLAQSLDNSVWFTFEGDGNDYLISTSNCGGTSTFYQDDTQMAIYSGNNCGSLTPVYCNDDIDAVNANYFSAILVETNPNTTYYVLVDGFNYVDIDGEPAASGDFCLEVTNTVVSVNEVNDVTFVVYPNPAQNQFTVSSSALIEAVNVYDVVGQLVMSNQNINAKTFQVSADFVAGVYTVEMVTAFGKSTTRVVIQ